MVHTESSFKTADGLTVFTQTWKPGRDAVAAVALVHGLGEHSGRYAHVAKAFTEAGFVISALDLRGHGKSGGTRGHFPSYTAVMDDLDLLLVHIRKNFPGKPVFLYGHSLGGALVLYYGLTRKSELQGIIASSPGLAAGSPVSPVTLIIGKVLYNLLPEMTLPNGLNLEYLSHDPQVKQAYVNDPLVHRKISARLGLDLLKNGQFILQKAPGFPYPLLLLQGSGDRIVDPNATQTFAQNAGEGVTFRLFDGQYHELHNETIKEQVLTDMLGWISETLTLSKT